jgi:hypothetical protein
MASGAPLSTYGLAIVGAGCQGIAQFLAPAGGIGEARGGLLPRAIGFGAQPVGLAFGVGAGLRGIGPLAGLLRLLRSLRRVRPALAPARPRPR